MELSGWIIVSNNPGRRFSSVSMATCARRTFAASVGNRSAPRGGGALPLSLRGNRGGGREARRRRRGKSWTKKSVDFSVETPLPPACRFRFPSQAKPGPDASEAKSFRFYYPLLKQSSHDVGRAHRSTLAPNFTLLPPPRGRARATRAAPGILDFSVLPPSALANTLSATELTGYTAPLLFEALLEGHPISSSILHPLILYFEDFFLLTIDV